MNAGWVNPNFRGLSTRYGASPTLIDAQSRASTRVETRAEQVRELERQDHRPVVILNRSILEAIKKMRNGLEDSAWLVGRRGQEGKAIEAHRSMWPAAAEDRAPGHIQIHVGEAHQIDEALRSQRQEVVGHWHVQPENSLPSDADLDAWRSLRRDLGLDSFVGVIVRERLTGPVDVRAFVVDRDDAWHAAIIEWRGLS